MVNSAIPRGMNAKFKSRCVLLLMIYAIPTPAFVEFVVCVRQLTH